MRWSYSVQHQCRFLRHNVDQRASGRWLDLVVVSFSTRWAGILASSCTTCPNKARHWYTMISCILGRSCVLAISKFSMRKCHLMSSIWCWQFMWTEGRVLPCTNPHWLMQWARVGCLVWSGAVRSSLVWAVPRPIVNSSFVMLKAQWSCTLHSLWSRISSWAENLSRILRSVNCCCYFAASSLLVRHQEWCRAGKVSHSFSS